MQSSGELEKVRNKIEELEGQIKGTTDQGERTAMLNVLAAMRQKEVLLMQGEQALGALTVNPRCLFFAVRKTLSCILIHLQG